MNIALLLLFSFPHQILLGVIQGEGVQHLALMSNDIFRTLKCMREVNVHGGLEFMASQPPEYYERVRKRVGDNLTDDQYREAEKLGVLIDKDDQGILLQIFTKPIGDRPTIFFEIIQVRKEDMIKL